jgi:excisionase family DNA binding protein
MTTREGRRVQADRRASAGGRATAADHAGDGPEGQMARLSRQAVQWIRHAYNIPAPAPYADGEISVAEAARRLGCSTGIIYYWIQAGPLDARRGPGNRLCITWNDRIQAACRDRIAASGHLNPPARRTRHRRR